MKLTKMVRNGKKTKRLFNCDIDLSKTTSKTRRTPFTIFQFLVYEVHLGCYYKFVEVTKLVYVINAVIKLCFNLFCNMAVLGKL